MKTAPDFVIAGAPKCGTTSLHHWLDQHPSVHMLRGEPHYFAHDLAYNQPAMPERRYAALCRAAGQDRQIGDRSTWYLYSERAAGAIQAANPNARIIILLRQPAELLHSLHAHFCQRGQRETITDLRAALAMEPARRRGEQLPPHGGFVEKFFYSSLADYTPGIQRFIDAFGPDRVRVVLLDELRDRPQATYAALLEFLELDAAFAPDFEVHNRSAPIPDSLWRRAWRSGTWRYTVRRLRPAWLQQRQLERKHKKRAQAARSEPWPKLDAELRQELTRRFEPAIQSLETLIGKDLGHWRTD